MEKIFDPSLDLLESFFQSLDLKTERMKDEHSDLLEVTTKSEIVSIYTETFQHSLVHGWHSTKLDDYLFLPVEKREREMA